jgi:hypothetical protein
MPGYTQDGEQTVGWAGNGGTSKAAEPSRRKRYNQIVRYVENRRSLGATWREVAAVFRLHHGEASGPLSTAHKDGDLAKLTEKRERCGVYVHPKYVNGRDTVKHGSTARSRQIQEAYNRGYEDGAQAVLGPKTRMDNA